MQKTEITGDGVFPLNVPHGIKTTAQRTTVYCEVHGGNAVADLGWIDDNGVFSKFDAAEASLRSGDAVFVECGVGVRLAVDVISWDLTFNIMVAM